MSGFARQASNYSKAQATGNFILDAPLGPRLPCPVKSAVLALCLRNQLGLSQGPDHASFFRCAPLDIGLL
jgi:hypothetical protein